jgi:OmpA-OmpF porin, OOP family
MNKRIRLLLFCFTGFLSLHAQQVKLGGEIGFHSASVIEKNNIPGWDSTTKNLYSSKTGLHIGIILEIPISKRFYFQPGLNYTSKGRQYTKYYDSTGMAITDSVYAKSKLQLGYMEIPMYFTYKLPLSASRRNNFFIGAGPYFAFILNASMNSQGLTQTNDTTQSYANNKTDLLIGNAVDKYKTFDLGINAKAGFEFGNVTLSGYFSRGLSNFYTAPYNGTFHHQVYGATLSIWLARSGNPPPKPVVIDTDNDGIPDKEDKCPLQPGTKKYHGCPVPDTDKDGIDDEHDSCKTIPGLARYNGCPVPDSDKDGIDDEHDSCKTIPGIAKYNGCPIPDKDGDGVNDEEDKCPDVAGTAANHGCPEIKKEVTEKVNYVAHYILFATKSDSLAPSSYLALNDLVDLLNKHPELHLTIEGHTDNVGTAEHNMTLSEKRAGAVKSYLLLKGINESRITAIGYGMDKPIADNNTPQGKAKNRRVELKVALQ